MSDTVFVIAGTRPNFMKAAPVLRALKAYPETFRPLFIHTGQHYDPLMSEVLIEELGMPKPDILFRLESQTHSGKIAEIMRRFSAAAEEHKPKMTLVFGDVNSTIAAAVMSLKARVPVAHVEAGLRSFDRRMPEELNRIITDHVSDWHYTTEESATQNLLAEGCDASTIRFVGNTMIDSVLQLLPKIKERADTLDVPEGSVFFTLHRQENVDDPRILTLLVKNVEELALHRPVFWPMHPRTRAMISQHGLEHSLKNIRVTEPLGYIDCIAHMMRSALIVTDSGGLQEESTALRVPCLTLRDNTERPVTLTHGTNVLVPPLSLTEKSLLQHAADVRPVQDRIPPLWDGKAAERIVEHLKTVL